MLDPRLMLWKRTEAGVLLIAMSTSHYAEGLFDGGSNSSLIVCPKYVQKVSLIFMNMHKSKEPTVE